MAWEIDGEVVSRGQPRTFRAVPLGNATLPAGDREALAAFQRKVARLQRAVLGATRAAGEAGERLKQLRQAAIDTPGGKAVWIEEIDGLDDRLRDLLVRLSGDPVAADYNEPQPPSIAARVGRIIESQWESTSAPTGTNREAYRIAGNAFREVLAGLTTLIESDLAGLERRLEDAGAPWTPGRVPRWEPE
jgi:hypothetical protein